MLSLSYFYRGGVVFSLGKGVSSREHSEVILTGFISSRVDTGGEHDNSIVTIVKSIFFEFPMDYGTLKDDDNDCLYVKHNADVVVQDSYFLHGKRFFEKIVFLRILFERVFCCSTRIYVMFFSCFFGYVMLCRNLIYVDIKLKKRGNYPKSRWNCA